MASRETGAVLAQLLQSAAVADDLSIAVKEHTAPSVIVHLPDGGVGEGENAADFLAEARSAFPDFALSVTGTMVADDRAVLQLVMEGTHAGVFRGFAPTGKAVRLPICVVLRIEAGLIAEVWYYANLYAPLVGTLS